MAAVGGFEEIVVTGRMILKPDMAARVIGLFDRAATAKRLHVGQVLYDPERRAFLIVCPTKNKTEVEGTMLDVVNKRAAMEPHGFVDARPGVSVDKEPYKDVIYPTLFANLPCQTMVDDLRTANLNLTLRDVFDTVNCDMESGCGHFKATTGCIISTDWAGTLVYLGGQSEEAIKSGVTTIGVLIHVTIKKRAAQLKKHAEKLEKAAGAGDDGNKEKNKAIQNWVNGVTASQARPDWHAQPSLTNGHGPLVDAEAPKENLMSFNGEISVKHNSSTNTEDKHEDDTASQLTLMD